MDTCRQVQHAGTQTGSALTAGRARLPRSGRLAQPACRIIILALILGSAGAEAAVTSAAGGDGRPGGYQPAASVHVSASAGGSGHTIGSPWMY